MDVLAAIGHTSMVRLRRVVPPHGAGVFAKLEWENPTGSMKDRMAETVISRAEADGRLMPGGTVVEYTGGSTGTSLALVCAARGYRLQIVTSDAFSQEKRDHLAALGAELTLVPSEGGRTTKTLILEMIETARALSRRPGTYWTDQLNNHDAIAGYHALGEEIWGETGGPSTRSSTAWEPPHRCGAWPPCSNGTSRACGSWRSSRRSRRSCSAVRPVPTRSKAWESATCLRCGSPHSSTRSWRSRPTRRSPRPRDDERQVVVLRAGAELLHAREDGLDNVGCRQAATGGQLLDEARLAELVLPLHRLGDPVAEDRQYVPGLNRDLVGRALPRVEQADGGRRRRQPDRRRPAARITGR